jgi:hypothetical protein
MEKAYIIYGDSRGVLSDNERTPMKWKKSYVMSIRENLINTDVIVDELITQLTFDKVNAFPWTPL